MKKLITPEKKHLLYKDEINDCFVLTKYMEIYKISDSRLGCLCWSNKTIVKLRKQGVVLNEWFTDCRLYHFECKVDNLPILIQCGAPKRRIHKNGKLLHKLEKRLAHKIIPFNASFNNKAPLLQKNRT